MASPRILVIGAGSRGNAYAKAITSHPSGHIVAIVEPVAEKRRRFSNRYGVTPELCFESWEDLISDPDKVRAAVDAVCICTLDESHAEIFIALRPLGLHTLVEKPLATSLRDCRTILAAQREDPPSVFAIAHVLRYSPLNRLLHRLLVEEKVVGDVVNINHTEPVGYWHFAHSYVRGNWRKGAPSLLTKCCHDVDLLLWWAGGHQPAFVSSHGSLVAFRKRNKPVEAGGATNCLACPAERSCLYSAKRIYVEEQLRGRGELGWPNKVVAPEIEGEEMGRAEEILMGRLAEDYDIEDGGRSWYGRCVFEAGNEVVDNQVVVLEWEDGEEGAAKTATLTMVAHTERICERFTKVYGTRGEVTSDGRTVSVCDFKSGETRVYVPEVDEESGHGGGDAGLAGAFVDAVEAVLGGMSVEEAQRRFVGCEVEEAVRAHEVVFWAEDARLERRVLGWEEWRGRVDGS